LLDKKFFEDGGVPKEFFRAKAYSKLLKWLVSIREADKRKITSFFLV